MPFLAGIALEQLRLVFGDDDDVTNLDENRRLWECLRELK
jgi:hypothetical protein